MDECKKFGYAHFDHLEEQVQELAQMRIKYGGPWNDSPHEINLAGRTIIPQILDMAKSS